MYKSGITLLFIHSVSQLLIPYSVSGTGKHCLCGTGGVQ